MKTSGRSNTGLNRFALLVAFSTAILGISDMHSAFAQNCADVRLDREGSLQSVPVLQPPYPRYISPYIASAMLDAHRFARGDKKPDHLTSPIAILVANEPLTSDASQKLVSATDVLKNFAKTGSCSLKAVANRFGSLDVFDLKARMRQIYEPAKSAAFGSPDRAKLAQNLQCLMADDAKMSIVGMDDLQRAMGQENSDAFFAQVIKDVCQPTLLPVSALDIQFVNGSDFSDPRSRQQKFSSVLSERIVDKTSEPLGLQICSAVLVQFGKGQQPRIGPQGQPNMNSCGPQDAMVVGSRNKNGTCQYLVRSSIANCDHYHPFECEAGQEWVDRDALISNTLTAFYIK